MKKKPKIGSNWRTLVELDNGQKIGCKGNGDSVFDELVIDSFLHVEQMNTNQWWMQVGDAAIWVTIDRKGEAKLSIMRGEYCNCKHRPCKHITDK